jgi:hypothetical protein
MADDPTKVTAKEILGESIFLQSPSNMFADAKLAKRLLQLGPDSGRTRSQIEELGRERQLFRGLAERHEADVQNIRPEQQAIRGAASSAAAQQLRDQGAGTDARSTLAAALRTAKARQGIIQRGDSAIRSQGLKDRLAIVRQNLGRRSSAIDLQGAGEQIVSGIDLSAQRASDQISASRAGAAGAAVGATAAMFKGNKDNNGSFFDFGNKG